MRRLYRVLRLLILLVFTAYFAGVLFVSLSVTYGLTVPLRGAVCCLDLPHEAMHFQTADGLKLTGWYIPPKNGAVIILLHTYYGNRLHSLSVARLLVRRGYGVLMYDQRASGESEGDVRSLGWLDIADVSKAAGWLQTRPAVTQIGAYGCSMGGAIALAAAAQNPSIAAVVADAPSFLTFDESRLESNPADWSFGLPVSAFYYSFVALRAGTLPPISTHQALRAIAPRPLLLISSGQAGERQRVDGFFTIAGEPKSHWHIPEAGHCGGASLHPDEYEQHLVDFFDQSFFNR